MILIYILIVYSIVNIIVYEDVFKSVVNIIKKYKVISKIISCPTCLSFWVGMIVYFLFNFNITGEWFDFILSGLLSSGSVNLIEHIKIRIGL